MFILGYFGCLNWSYDEQMIVYVAELKEDKKQDNQDTFKSKFEYKQTWGETFGKKAFKTEP